MPLSNKERLELLLEVGREIHTDSESLDALIEDAEVAVIRDEEAEAPSPFTVVGAIEYDAVTDTFSPFDAAGNRYRSDGSLVSSPEEPGRNLP